MSTACKTKTQGRPREFDLEEATEKAMRVFWARGYEGASMAELTQAMGISKPSLYAAFGDKRGLFEAALDRYAAGPRAFGARALALPTARETVLALLQGAVAVSTRTAGPKGCLYTHAALACSVEADDVRTAVAKRRLNGEARLRARLEMAKAGGELPARANIAALSKWVATLTLGITVEGASGVSRRALDEMVEFAMQMWDKQAGVAGQATASGK